MTALGAEERGLKQRLHADVASGRWHAVEDTARRLAEIDAESRGIWVRLRQNVIGGAL
jgi:hypothetical protein